MLGIRSLNMKLCNELLTCVNYMINGDVRFRNHKKFGSSIELKLTFRWENQ